MRKKEDLRRIGSERRVLLEYIPVGASVKVVAIDEETGLEVCIVGARSISQSELQRIAVRKLQKRLRELGE